MPNTGKNMKYVCHTRSYARVAIANHGHLLEVQATTRVFMLKTRAICWAYRQHTIWYIQYQYVSMLTTNDPFTSSKFQTSRLHSNVADCIVRFIYINIYVNVPIFLILNLRKFFTDCFEILTQRCIRIRECLLIYMWNLYMEGNGNRTGNRNGNGNRNSNNLYICTDNGTTKNIVYPQALWN
jgi:hypothetical protein